MADLEGAQQTPPPPPKIWSTVCAFFLCGILFCVRMLKNKAQIARERIKNQVSGISSTRDVRPRTYLRPLIKWKS